MRTVAVLVVLCSGCSGDGGDRVLAVGFTCGGLIGNGCPPGTECVPNDPRVADGDGKCYARAGNVCLDAPECSLSGYACIDGACLPAQRCSSDAECPVGMCWFGPTPVGGFHPGVCVEPGSDCPASGPPLCESGCVFCIWGEWSCASPGIYPGCPSA